MIDREKIPKLTTNGVTLLAHEMSTIAFLQSRLFEDIELIPPSHMKGMKRPDFWMLGLMWEMKSATVGTKKAIERLFFCAAMQSGNIVMDLRRIRGDDGEAVKTLEKCFLTTRKVRNLYIITKKDELKEYKNRG